MPDVGHPGPHRRILAISIPAILANSSAPLVGLVDTWAVGHLPGALHLAAVGLGSVIFNYLFWAFGFLRMGTTGLVAQSWGRGDEVELARVVARSSSLALLIGAVMWVTQEWLLAASLKAMAAPQDVTTLTATYFRIRIWAAPATLLTYTLSGVLFGLGRTRAVLAVQLLLNISNAGLNLWFVVGLDMGVPGVALGTLIAQWLAAGFSIWVIRGTPGARFLHQVLRERRTWARARFRPLVVINGFIFLRTIFLMTALALIMREAGRLGDVGMAASHVASQFMLLIALGLDGFAHAAEALAGAAWGHGRREDFRRWVRLTGLWALLAAGGYALFFWWFGEALTGLLTDIPAVRATTRELLPFMVALPLVAVWCYHFDGVYIGATAATAMMVTMGIAFGVYIAVLGPLIGFWGLRGLWGAVLVFMGVRGIAQALWYPRLLAHIGQSKKAET